MDGWVVRPDAPALTDRFHAGLLEARAAGLYNASLSPAATTIAPPSDATKWADLEEAGREPFRDLALVEVPRGRYELQPDGPDGLVDSGLTLTGAPT